jgi:hypothetical protein
MGEFVALLCAPELQRLVVIPRASLGDIYLLEADGTPVVRYQWSDFRSFAMLEDAEGYSVLSDAGGLNRFIDAALDAPLRITYRGVVGPGPVRGVWQGEFRSKT